MRRPSGGAATFAALQIRLHRALDGRLQGENSGLRLGPGSDPAEVVRYRPGEDDVRRIDWNVSARSLEPHVWRTQAEHELQTWVLVDESPSMDFGTAELEKADLARLAVAAIGLLTDGPGNTIGTARLRSEGLVWTRPRSSRLVARQAMHPSGSGAAQPDRDQQPGSSYPALADALLELGGHRARAGLRVVISDFVEPDGTTERPFAWEAPLRRLARRHDTVVVEVLDPRELELPDVGPVVLLDPETGHTCEVWTSLPRIRERYATTAAAHRQAVADAVRAAGCGHVVLRTDRDWVADLAHFVLRQRRTPRPRRTR